MKVMMIAATGLVLLLFTLGAEAELCAAHSRTWKGRCSNNMDCANICVGEGNTGGHCKGKLIRECVCTNDCGAGGGKGKPAPGGDKGKPAPGDGGAKPAPGGGAAKPVPGGGAAKPAPGGGAAKPSPGGGAAKPAPGGGGAVQPPPVNGGKGRPCMSF